MAFFERYSTQSLWFERSLFPTQLSLTFETDDETSGGRGRTNGLIKKPKNHLWPVFSPDLAFDRWPDLLVLFSKVHGSSQKTWYFV